MTQTLEQPQTGNGNAERLPSLSGPRLPYHPAVEERFGIDKASWKALVEAIFPNASSVESVILALSYCRARKLDPFKRVVHIVPIWSRDLGRMVDTVWPGIGELRTTAFRTGEYAGRDASVFGPDITKEIGKTEMTFPEWGQVTVYRMVKGQRVAFAGPRVYWEETYATRKRDDDSPNEMWGSRPRGQLDKCAEAAALRAGFPEEVGCDYIPEEVDHHAKRVDSRVVDERPNTGASGVLAQIEHRQQQGKRDDDPSPDAQVDPPQDDASQVTGGHQDESQAPPSAVPAHGRTDAAWINDIVLLHKPQGMTKKQAVDKFHAADVPSWDKLPADRQDEKYKLLMEDAFPWK